MTNCNECDKLCTKVYSCKKCLTKLDKYLSKKCVLKYDISDVPTDIITNTTFSLSDIAKDVIRVRETCLSNPMIQQFINDPLISDPVFVQKANRILVNISRNVVNDPATPPPDGYIKRVTIITTDGNVIVDVNTYIDDMEGVLLGLNNDTNMCCMNLHVNVIDKQTNPLQTPIYDVNSHIPSSNPYITTDLYFNTNNINPSGISQNPPGLKRVDEYIRLSSNRTYTYPADEINPTPTGGTAVEFINMINHGVRKEVQMAIIQDWGWASRRSGSFYQLPCYFVANNIQQKDGYSLVLRVGYIKYK